VIALDAVLNGLVLGGMYALVAIGLNFQYGIARIMNLSYGEGLMLAAYGTFWLFTLGHVSPLIGLIVVTPVAFGFNWLVFQILLQPLIRRAASREVLERDSILVTFGLLFLLQGAAQWAFGGTNRGYSYLALPVNLGEVVFSLNRLVAFGVACLLGLAAFLFLRHTRTGTALRAMAVDPVAARLVAIDVRRYGALAFASGGAMIAASGSLVSMFLSFNPSTGIVFTLKALIVVILGGVGHMGGSLVAGLILGLAENLTGFLVDPGLTLAVNYALFLLILLVRPTGLFGKA
jgi:branched-chain amino acid transport system permease protein